jgi:hypothetical protein
LWDIIDYFFNPEHNVPVFDLYFQSALSKNFGLVNFNCSGAGIIDISMFFNCSGKGIKYPGVTPKGFRGANRRSDVTIKITHYTCTDYYFHVVCYSLYGIKGDRLKLNSTVPKPE